MGGEYICAFVYGFDYNRSCAKLRSKVKFYLGTEGTGGRPIYYCIQLKSTTLEDVQKEINNLTESQKNVMSEFDKFAEKYDNKPTWMLACIGDIDVDVRQEPSKEYLLEQFHKLIKDIDKLYNDDGSFTEDADDCIVCIFQEENMDFMIDKARKLKTFEEIYEMIENYYME